MRKLIYLCMLVVLVSCGSEGLDVKFKTIYKSAISKQSLTNAGTSAPTQGSYTQFGKFVGTITPGMVMARFATIRFTDKKELVNGSTTIVDVISPNLPDNDPTRLADFTNGNTVEVTPQMFGNIGNDGWFADDNIRLQYLGIFTSNLNIDFELPAQFANQALITDGVNARREGNTLKCNLRYFMERFGDGYDIRGFVFGGTDSSFIVRQSSIPAWDNVEMIRMAQPGEVARVSNFDSPVLRHPDKGSSATVTTTISFNSSQLIEHYEGYDNQPYTADDVFVFAPEFWKRFSVKISQN